MSAQHPTAARGIARAIRQLTVGYVRKRHEDRKTRETRRYTRHAALNLNGDWDFKLFPAGEEAAEQTFADGRADYDRTIVVPFSWVAPLSKVQENVAGIGWYRRTVRFAPKGRLFLCFGAVDYVADVYVNGAHAGHHQGGYTYFELDVTALWHEGANVVEVRAEDYRRETQTHGKQGYGETQGIWQTVWLEDRPQAYIEDFRIVTKCSGDVQITAQVQGPDGATLTAAFDGRAFSKALDLPAGEASVELDFALENPRLWSPDEPNLYEGELRLGEDCVSTYFGVREIEAKCAPGKDYPWIYLNGRST